MEIPQPAFDSSVPDIAEGQPTRRNDIIPCRLDNLVRVFLSVSPFRVAVLCSGILYEPQTNWRWEDMVRVALASGFVNVIQFKSRRDVRTSHKRSIGYFVWIRWVRGSAGFLALDAIQLASRDATDAITSNGYRTMLYCSIVARHLDSCVAHFDLRDVRIRADSRLSFGNAFVQRSDQLPTSRISPRMAIPKDLSL